MMAGVGGACFHGAGPRGCRGRIAALVVEGGDAAFTRAFQLMILATAIDALDGPLARYARVQETLPGFDGQRLDDLIDF